MLDLDHIAITVKDLDESIAFYKMFGYELLERFSDDGYNWVTLRLNNHSLELFQLTSDKEKPIDHIAYNYDSDEEVLELMKRLGYKKEDFDIFFGDLNRESFFIEDNNGKSIQLIKKYPYDQETIDYI